MSEERVYEVDSSVILRFCFEVDAPNRGAAQREATRRLESYISKLKKEYDTYDIDIEQVEESEGH